MSTIQPKQERKRNIDLVVNVAILLTLAFVLLGRSGVVGSRIFPALDSWRAQRSIAQVWPDLINVGSRLDGSGSGANQTIVEFIDYECPSCRRIAEEVVSASASQGVDIVVRHLPLDMHPKARQAAFVAVCSEKHEVFTQAHKALLTNDDWLGEIDWLDWGASLGIDDLRSFESCLGDESTSRRVEQDIRLAESVRVRGTPTFVTKMGVFPGEQGLAAAIASLSLSRDVAKAGHR